MLLNIEKEREIMCLTYENDTDYFKMFDEIEDEWDKSLGMDGLAMLLMTDRKTYNSIREREVIKPAHRKYWNSCKYSLRELLNNFKAITKVYGEYLILDYEFKGVFLKDDDLHMGYCWFGADDEEFEDMNPHLLGKPLFEFVQCLSYQKQLGDIAVERVNVELLYNKPTKTRRRRTHIPKGMRHEVFKRDNYTCCECGARKSDGVRLHVDHIVPVSKGGSDELANLQTLCSDCNLNKSDVIQKKVMS